VRTTVCLVSIAVGFVGACMLNRDGQLYFTDSTGEAPSSGAGSGAGFGANNTAGGRDGVGGSLGTSPIGGSGAGTGAAGAGGATGGGGGAVGGAGGSPAIEQAGDLLVVLDALDASAGSATWANGGTLGDFVERGDPAVGQYNGTTAVQFDGVDDAYEGPITPATLEGASSRSIEVWVCNPDIGNEETLVAWANRGGPTNTNFTFNYGNNTNFGAVGHWANDMGWGNGGAPTANQWHHLAYVYDGTEALVYADGIEKSNLPVTLVTHADYSINIATQRADRLEYDHAGSLWIAIVRVHSEALTPAQVVTNFNLESTRFAL